MRETKAPWGDESRTFESYIILAYSCNAAIPGSSSAEREFSFELLDMHKE